MVLAAGLGVGGVYAFASPEGGSMIAGRCRGSGRQVVSLVRSTDCRIKANVSIDSGERIYHVPGQRYYADTTIRPEYGERWFCSEAERALAQERP
ncbi:MAG TPA: hypothetical protein VGD93_15440 [Devosia sp.]